KLAGQFVARRIPPQTTRETLLFVLACETHIKFCLVADRIIEARCELVSIVRPQHAVNVIWLARRGSQIGCWKEVYKSPAHRMPARSEIAAGRDVVVVVVVADDAANRAAGRNCYARKLTEVSLALFQCWN